MATSSENRRIHIWINDKEVKNNIKSIGGEYRKLQSELSKTTRGTDAYNKKIQEVRGARKILDEHRAKVNGVSKSWGMMKNVMAGVFAGNVVTAGMQRLIQFIPNLINKNAELSDSYADVAKTTGLSMQQVADMAKEMKGFNTRTPRKELLALARDAGKLGITGRENILQFVKAADQINVALGEDLGEGAIKDVGKLNQVFKVTERAGYDLEKSMLATGSAINSIGQSSTASEGYLVDYTKRLAGANTQAGISIENTLGFASVLDQLGQKVETSATAVSQFTINMFKDTATFAGIAGMEVKEFTDLLNTDANEALVKTLEGLNGNNEGLATMVKKFDELGIDGARATQVIATLAGNTDLLRKEQALSNREFAAATSLTEEFNVKNENLAASVAKLSKRMAAWVANSQLTSFLTTLVGSLADTSTEAEKLEKTWREQQRSVEKLEAEMTPLVDRYTELKEKGELSKEEHKELRTILDQINTLMPNVANEWDEYNRVIGINTDLIGGNIEKQKEVARIKNKDAIKAVREELEGLVKWEALANTGYKETIKNLQYKNLLQEAESDLVKNQLKQTGRWIEYEAEINKAHNQYNERAKERNILIAEATLKLSELGEELTAEQKAMVDNVLGTNHFSAALQEAGVKMAEAEINTEDMRKTLEDLRKELEANVKAREALNFVDRTADEDKKLAGLKEEQGLLEKHIEQLEIELGLRDASIKKVKEEKVKREEYFSKMSTLMEQQNEMREKYLEAERRDMQTEFENLEEDYTNRLISYEEFLDRKNELMMADKLREEAGNLSYKPEVSDPSTVLEYLMSDKGDELLYQVEGFYNTAAGMYGSYLDIMHGMDQRRMNDIARTYDFEMDKLDKMLDSKTISQESYDYQREKADEKRRKQEAKIQLAAFKREKRFAIITATINTALAATKALAQGGIPAGIFMAALATAAGGLQIAAIASQPTPQFAEGTVLNGPSHKSGGMPIINPRTGRKEAEVEGGEILLTKGVSRDPKLAAAASALNVAGGGRALVPNYMRAGKQRYFADGGYAPKANADDMGMGIEKMVGEMQGLRKAFSQFPTQIEAIVYTDRIDKAYAEKSKADRLS